MLWFDYGSLLDPLVSLRQSSRVGVFERHAAHASCGTSDKTSVDRTTAESSGNGCGSHATQALS